MAATTIVAVIVLASPGIIITTIRPGIATVPVLIAEAAAEMDAIMAKVAAEIDAMVATAVAAKETISLGPAFVIGGRARVTTVIPTETMECHPLRMASATRGGGDIAEVPRVSMLLPLVGPMMICS